MNNASIINIATQHGIPTKQIDGRVYVADEYNNPETGEFRSTWVDATGWSYTTLKHWLGY